MPVHTESCISRKQYHNQHLLLFLLIVSTLSFCDCFSPATPSSATNLKSINTSTTTMTATTDNSAAVDDPYIWLEDVEAEECLEFAKSANDKCLEALGDPKTSSTKTYDRVLKVLESKDRIPHTRNYGKDEDGSRILYNFWKDEEHPKGNTAFCSVSFWLFVCFGLHLLPRFCECNEFRRLA